MTASSGWSPETGGTVSLARTRAALEFRVGVRVITPVYGLAVSQKRRKVGHRTFTTIVADSLGPFREESLRGALRFWWRATHGVRKKSLVDMHEQEAALWGSTRGVGAVSVVIERAICTLKSLAKHESDRLGYAIWPLRSVEGQWPLHWVRADGTPADCDCNAHLKITIAPDAESRQAEVLDAVRAWLTFGGIGGRTRRGFGALAVATSEACTFPECQVPFDVASYDNTAAPDLRLSANVPHLAWPLSVPRVRPVKGHLDERNALNALADGLGRMFEFRQGASHGRVVSQGCSRWPEPHIIRAMQDSDDRVPTDACFPRAQLGLPIVFQFLDDARRESVTLTPTDWSRWPSPVVLRPIERTDGYACTAFALAGPPPTALTASYQKGRDKKIIPLQVGEGHFSAHRVLEVPAGTAHTDAIEAFLAFFALP